MQHNRNKNKLLILALLVSVNICQANNYFNESKKGWFWGEEKEEIKEDKKVIPDFKNIKSNSQYSNENLKKMQEDIKKKDENGIVVYNGKEYKTIPNKTQIPWAILDTLDPKEISNIENESKSIAVMYPSEENIVEYKKLQHYIATKSIEFTDGNYLVTKKDPEISAWASNTSMKSSLEITTKRKDNSSKQNDVLSQHKSNMIILAATLPTCPYCDKQRPLLKQFYESYGIEYKEVDISKNKEFGIKYQVQKTPDLFLLYKDKSNEPLMTRFGNGLHTIQDLKSGVLAGLYTFKKIPKELLEY